MEETIRPERVEALRRDLEKNRDTFAVPDLLRQWIRDIPALQDTSAAELTSVLEWSGDSAYIKAEDILMGIAPKYQPKVCPFCGHSSFKTDVQPVSDSAGRLLKRVCMVCDYCGATGPKYTIDPLYRSEEKAAAIEKWNVRRGHTEKVYGYTLTDNRGFNSGQETVTRLFADEEKAMHAAYESYCRHFLEMFDETGNDAAGLPVATFNCFVDELQTDGYIVIQADDYHLEYAYIETIPGGDDA